MSELTEYELERRPQEINEFNFPLNSRLLYRELMCPICLDILEQTMTTRDCLHRFCSACINKVIKSNRKDPRCPTCRKKLTSRHLRPDPKFDQFIKLVYSDRVERTNSTEETKPTLPLECELILRHLKGQEARYLKCPTSGTVEHLCKYLSMRPERVGPPILDSSNKREFKMCIFADRSTGRFDQLEPTLRLDEIKDKYKIDMNRPLELYFFSPNKE